MSVFQNRPKEGPKWPTFRKAALGEVERELFRELRGLTSFSQGTQKLHIKDGKMLSYGGEIEEWLCVHFEIGRFVRKNTGTSSPLYFLVQLGQYPNGVIWHVGPQYPHVLDFISVAVEAASFQIYQEIAAILYRGLEIDSDVRKFIDAGKLMYRGGTES